MRNREAIAAIRLTLLGIDPYEACILGDAERIDAALEEGWNAGALSPDGFTALSLAAFFGHAAVFDRLLPLTTNLDQRADNAQRVAALHAATAARNITMVDKLLQAGADPDLSQAEGYRPIHVAAQHGDAPIVGLLLVAGADPRRANVKGETAIDHARAGGHVWLAERLQREADKFVKVTTN